MSGKGYISISGKAANENSTPAQKSAKLVTEHNIHSLAATPENIPAPHKMSVF
jgi:hypothetical protein